MELVKIELVSSQKGCYVKQHISKFGLIQNFDKMKYYKSPVCVYFTHVRHQMRKNCYVFSVNLGRPEIRIFCDKLLRGTQIWAEIHIFRPRGNGCPLMERTGCQDSLKFHSFIGDTILKSSFSNFALIVIIWWSTSMIGGRRQIHPDGSRADCYFGVPSFYSTQASGLCAVCGPFVILLLPYTAPNGLLLWQTYFVLTQAAVQHQEHLNCTHDQGSPITN